MHELIIVKYIRNVSVKYNKLILFNVRLTLRKSIMSNVKEFVMRLR